MGSTTNHTNKRKKLIKNSFFAFVLTIGFGYIFLFFDMMISGDLKSPESSIQLNLVWATIILPLYALFNLVFLLLVHFLKISRKLLLNLKLIILEVALYFILFIGINKLLVKIPYEYRFIVTPEQTSVRFYLDFPFEHIYAFIILLILIFVHKRLTKNTEI